MLAGHKVFVSPGATVVAAMTMGGASKLVLDEKVLMIEDKMFYVDGVCYGTLEKKAKIKLFFGEVRTVGVDVRPGSCRNPLNPASRGLLTVAVLGSSDVDVERLDVASLRLVGVPPVAARDPQDRDGPEYQRGQPCPAPTPHG